MEHQNTIDELLEIQKGTTTLKRIGIYALIAGSLIYMGNQIYHLTTVGLGEMNLKYYSAYSPEEKVCKREKIDQHLGRVLNPFYQNPFLCGKR